MPPEILADVGGTPTFGNAGKLHSTFTEVCYIFTIKANVLPIRYETFDALIGSSLSVTTLLQMLPGGSFGHVWVALDDFSSPGNVEHIEGGYTGNWVEDWRAIPPIATAAGMGLPQTVAEMLAAGTLHGIAALSDMDPDVHNAPPWLGVLPEADPRNPIGWALFRYPDGEWHTGSGKAGHEHRHVTQECSWDVTPDQYQALKQKVQALSALHNAPYGFCGPNCSTIASEIAAVADISLDPRQTWHVPEKLDLGLDHAALAALLAPLAPLFGANLPLIHDNMRLTSYSVGMSITPHVVNKVVDEMIAHGPVPGRVKFGTPTGTRYGS